MKLKPKNDKIEKDDDILYKNVPLSTRVNALVDACPFDLKEFYLENKGLVKKFLRKNTYDLEVDDWKDVPEDWYYKNNEGILRHNIPGKKSKYTALQMLEWIKCGVDIVYLTQKYVKIISIDDGVIPFKLYDYQEDLLNLYNDNRFVISMQARQSGKTQTTAAFMLHFAMFNASKYCAILANKSDQAQEILARVQMSYENLPLYLQPGVRSYNKRSMEFEHRSKIASFASGSSSIRGKSISLLYIDEAAFIPGDMEFYESTYPVISSGKDSRVIITSTPNGTRGLFHKLWKESVDKSNDYKNFLVTWDMVPGRDEEWRRQTISNTSPEQFAQEYECKFRGSQNSLLTAYTLESLYTKIPIEEWDDGLKVYYEVEKDHCYVITVDVSRGVGKDYHAFSVIDVSTKPYEVVAVYKNNRLSPMLYPNVIHNVAMKYNEAMVLVEINDIGEQVSSILFHDIEYENMVMIDKYKNRQVISFGGNSTPGVRTTTAVKSIGCSNIKTMVERGHINLNDMDMIDEFGTFVEKGRSYEADKGAHDDLVMTMVLFAWMTTQDFFIEMTKKDLRDMLLSDLEDKSMEDLCPFGIIDSSFYSYDGTEEGESLGDYYDF